MLPEQVLDVHEADDVVEIAFVHRQPRKAGHRHRAQHFVGRRVDIHRVQVDPRPHDVAHRALAQPQRAERELLLERLDDAFGRAGIDQCSMSSSETVGSGIEPSRSSHSTAFVEMPMNQTSGRATTAMNFIIGATRIASPSARCSEIRFGTSSPRISDAYVKHATNIVKRDSFGMLSHPRPRHLREPIAEIIDDLVTAVGGAKRADQRDADLHRRQKTIRIARELQCPLRVAAAFGGPLLQPAAARGNDRNLRRGKQPIGQNQHQDKQDFPNAFVGRAFSLTYQIVGKSSQAGKPDMPNCIRLAKA